MMKVMSRDNSDEFRKCCRKIGLEFDTKALIIDSRDVLLCQHNYREVMYFFNVRPSSRTCQSTVGRRI